MNIKKPSKKEILIALIFFALGSFSMFLFKQNQIHHQNQQAKSLVLDARDLFETEHTLITSCFEAYSLLTDCVFDNSDQCDPDEFNRQINIQTQVRDESLKYIQSITKDIEQTIKQNNW